jgi:hypothetical protein
LKMLTFMNRIRCFSQLLLVMLLLGVAVEYSKAQTPSKELTVINLEKYGWQPLPHSSVAEPREPSGQVLAIDHQRRVLVGYTAREHGGLATRENPSLAFRILRFGADGTLQFAISVPTSRWFGNGFYLDEQDHILTKTSDAFQILVGDEELHEGTGKVIAPCSVHCVVRQSASHRTLLLRGIPGFGQQLMYIDTASSAPSVIHRCDEVSPYFVATITDRFAYSSRQESMNDATLNRWPLCDHKKLTEIPIRVGGALHALNDELFVLIHSDGAEVISKDGHRQFLWPVPKNDVVLNQVAPDESGERFAVQIVSFRGGSAVLDIGGHVVARRVCLYGAKTGRQIASIPVRQTYDSVFSFYLSPDGHELAVLEDGTVTLKMIE